MTPVKDAGSRQVNRKKCHFWSSNHPLAAGKEVKIGKNRGEIEAFGGEKRCFQYEGTPQRTEKTEWEMRVLWFFTLQTQRKGGVGG